MPHAANGNSKKKKDIEEYFGSEIDLNKPALNKADLKLRGLINPPPPKDEGIKLQKILAIKITSKYLYFSWFAIYFLIPIFYCHQIYLYQKFQYKACLRQEDDTQKMPQKKNQ